MITTHITNIADEVMGELYNATSKFGAFASAHEGFAIILEEIDELKAEIWKNQKIRDAGALRKEAIQVAAMAMRFVLDVCDKESR